MNTKEVKQSLKYVNIKKNGDYEIKEDIYSISITPKQDKLGVMLVGLGGNNGTTFSIGLQAHQLQLEWENKRGTHKPVFFGSISQLGSVHIGYKDDKPHSKLFKDMGDMANPEDIVLDGWDICSDDLYTTSKKNGIVDYDLREQLHTQLESIVPLPSVYYPDFIATNQKSRADNILKNKNKWEDVMCIINDIKTFKAKNKLNKVIIVWTASTERFTLGKWKDGKELIKAIKNNDPEISPSIVFAVASILSDCIFLNGSPQNTLVPSVIDLAKEHNTFVGGEDFKTGQTKLKSVLADFIASAGIKPLSIVSYNHLGNNDGKNLDEAPQFKSKEFTKKNVIDDIVDNNPALFNGKKPDHCVVIKYVPAVGDSKRAMDEYVSELFLDGRNTLAIHNTCEDSLLAVPLILDIILFSDFFSRVRISNIDDKESRPLSSVLSFLSFFFKAPIVSEKEPLVNSFFSQRYGLENFFRLCNGLPPRDFLNLHCKL
jgi:myo-inositol-1-phosphate synthase